MRQALLPQRSLRGKSATPSPSTWRRVTSADIGIGNQARLRALLSAPPHAQAKQRTATVEPPSAPSGVEGTLAMPGSPLPEAERAFFEPRLRHDLGEVRTHTGRTAAESARSIDALAYTIGQDIVFAEGRYAPGTAAGRRLMAHELAHVIQQGAAPVAQALGLHAAPGPTVARDAADDEIESIEGEKIEIRALLDRCTKLTPELRDQMIEKIGDHAQTTHEERQLACLLAVRFKGVMQRADFHNTYHGLLERLPGDQSSAVLDHVGNAVIGKTSYDGAMIDKQSINNVGMKGAPGSSIKVGRTVYVIVDGGVQFKTSDAGGPAGRNNNPGNITVDDNAPAAWSPEIGAYRGRNTDGRFAIFGSYKQGRVGAIAWATKRATMSLLSYFKSYAPSSEKGNNPETYADTVAASVSAAIGKPVNRGTVIQDIIDAKAMEAFVDGQEKAEGFTRSNVSLVPRDSPDLPQEVRDFVAEFDKATGGTASVAGKVATRAAKEKSP